MADNNLPNGGNGGNNGEANIELQKEIDKAVTKALATQKAKLDKEYNDNISALQGKLAEFENAGLTDAEKVAKQLQAAKEAESAYNEKIKRLEIAGEFKTMGIEETDYAPIVDDYFKGDFKSATAKISSIIEKKAAAKAESLYNEQIKKTPNPKTGGNDKPWTKETFAALTYSQQMEEISKDQSLIKLLD